MGATNTSRKVFTTGQIAKICKVAPRTVSKWFDAGRLKGYRIPGSQDRRVPRDNLIKFLREHGMPTDALKDTWPQVLLVTDDKNTIQRAESINSEESGIAIHIARNAFEAGSVHAVLNLVVIDFTIGRSDAINLMRLMRTRTEGNYPATEYIAILCEDEVDPDSFEVPGMFDVAHKQPFNITAMIEAMFTEQPV